MLVVVFAAFVAGLLIRRVAGPNHRSVALIDRWVLWVALPALIVTKMSRATVGGDVVVPVLVAWGAVAVSVPVITAVGRTMMWDRSTVGALLMVGVLGNTSFLGLGVVEGLLGARWLPSAIAFDQLGTFLALATFGTYITSRFGAGESGWRPVFGRLIRFGPFLALLVSPVVAVLNPPPWFHDVLGVPAATVAPTAMLALGWRFAVDDVRNRARVVGFGLAWKMVVVPGVVVLASVVVGSPSDGAWAVSVLQAGAPPMVTAGVVATAAGMDAPTVSVMVAIGTLLAFVTLPVWWLVVR